MLRQLNAQAITSVCQASQRCQQMCEHMCILIPWCVHVQVNHSIVQRLWNRIMIDH